MSDQSKHDPRYDDLARQYEGSPRRARPIHTGLLEYAANEACPLRQHVGPIEYYGPDPHGSSSGPVPAMAQYFLGFMAPFLATGLGCLLSAARISPENSLVIGVVAVIAISIYVRVHFRWRAFIPGVLTTVLLIPLLFIGAIYVVCGGAKL